MKILQVHNFYRNRGGECSTVEAEKHLLEEGGITALRFAADSKKIAAMTLSEKVKAYLQIPSNKLVAQRLIHFVQKHNPDVAHVHNVFPLISPAVYGFLKQNGVPIVQTVHNFRLICPNGLCYINRRVCEDCRIKSFKAAVRNRCVQGSFITSVLYAWAIKRGWRRDGFVSLIDCYIALNKFALNKLIEAGIPKDKIYLCGNFVTDFADAPSENKTYALYIGRLSTEKGLHTLLEAAKHVPALTIKIAGKGPLEQELKSLSKDPSLSHVEFVGYVTGDQKASLVHSALCTVVPSECYENFPISVIESLAMGTPVLASRMGGLPELIEHIRNGLIFEAGNVHELAECLRAVVTNSQLAGEMAKFALSDARIRFSPERHLRELLSIYEQTISPKKVKAYFRN